MLASDGQVYGLIDAMRTDAAGIGYAVSPATATARLLTEVIHIGLSRLGTALDGSTVG